jgi:predicted TIM-barrel fold metal-dependent hydrolase
MLTRRGFLAACSAGALSVISPASRAEWLWHGCGPTTIPESLVRHAFMQHLWQGIDPAQFWDCHVHLLGRGDNGSGAWINPRMDSYWHPIERLQKAFYLNAACVSDQPGMDQAYVTRLLTLLAAYPPGAKLMLLAFDWHYQEDGRRFEEHSPFYTPNAYAQRLAREHPQRFEWIASVHPYREDAIEALEQAAKDGARALKWLPAAQGIDPADARCDRFYETLARLKLPLLTHAGRELAVHGGRMQDYGNPLRLRRALDRGVRVIVAHCASLGKGIDLDRGPDGPVVSNFRLFARLMDEARYAKHLYGDLAAVGQLLRAGEPLRVLIQRRDWQTRLLYGSDYPLPGVLPIFSPRGLASDGFLTQEQAEFLSELRRYNPLLFDFALKRLLAVDGQGFDPVVFESRRVFVGDR